ncbi:MAG: hypothetical protein ARM1_0735 [Candidatus Micrarchaeota archaeon]|nr:MAG: hypothetical protein ARM1_0735 [Candidatus Micrarchaeota archaeon]
MKLFWSSKEKIEVNVTSVIATWAGSQHVIDDKGFIFNKKSRILKIPFSNYLPDEIALEDMLQSRESFSVIKLNDILVNKPFIIESIKPKPPLTIKPNEQVDLLIKVRRPEMSYTGPLRLDFIGERSDNTVKIEIPKLVIRYNGSKIEDSSEHYIIRAPKGYIFNIKIQLAKYIEAGKRVESIKAEKPFEIIDTDPKTPFTIDKDHNLIELKIKMPDISIASELELIVE